MSFSSYVFFLQIVKALDEEGVGVKKTYYVLINQTDRSADATQLTKKAMCEFQPHEVEYLKVRRTRECQKSRGLT